MRLVAAEPKPPSFASAVQSVDPDSTASRSEVMFQFWLEKSCSEVTPLVTNQWFDPQYKQARITRKESKKGETIQKPGSRRVFETQITKSLKGFVKR